MRSGGWANLARGHLSLLHRQIHIYLADIMRCSSWLVFNRVFDIPGYQFVCNNRLRGKGGGVAIYLLDKYRFSVCHDLTVNHDLEFESLFIEVTYNSHSITVGEIYRVPNSNGLLSIQRYEALLDKLNHAGTVQITFIFIGQTHLVFGKCVCTCVTKHSNAFRTFLNWLKNSKRVWHERKLHILRLPIFANFDLWSVSVGWV